jgi:3-phosphoshikimate 1-carboxyvinyltransferase
MLHRFGARVEVESLRVSVNGPASLRAEEIVVPGDISSAAFFLAAAAMISGSELLLRNVGLNRTRTGFLSLLRRMGADIFGADTRDDGLNEPSGNITVRGTDKLKAVHIGAEDIPALIDEVPILAVTALRADGTTVIEGASELRVKETDRLSALAKNLSALGTRVKEEPDGLIIDGPQRICGGTVDSFGDHRIAMAMAVAGLIADGPVTITDTDCVATSFPGFFEVIRKVTWQE